MTTIMVTMPDHVENMRQRLLQKKQETEASLREIMEMIRVLGEIPRVLTGKGRDAQEIRETRAQPVVRNDNLSKLVDDYIAEYPYDQIINVKAMIEHLKSEKGVRGKDKSLDAYIRSILKKRAVAGKLHHDPGTGFSKTRGEDKHSVLVASA